MERRKRRVVISGAATLAVLAAVLALIFRGQGEEVLQCLRAVPLFDLTLLLLPAFCCTLLGTAAQRVALRPQLPGLTFGQSLTVSYLGIFGNVATMGASSVPLQSWYLSRHGLLPGAGVGTLTACYVLQKVTVLLYATAMLLLQGEWLRASHPSLARYLFWGYAVCALIVLALILLCTWERAQRLALWCVGKLPHEGKWARRKSAWSANIKALRAQSQALLTDRRRCGAVMLLYAGKYFLLHTVSYLSISLLGLGPLPFWRVQLLSSVMELIVSALPNVGGVGPAEFAFALLYAPYLGSAGAASAMVLYRMASYLFPFFVSIPFVLGLRRLVRQKKGRFAFDSSGQQFPMDSL